MKKLLALLLALVLGASCAMAENTFVFDNSQPFSMAVYQENWGVYLRAVMGDYPTLTWQESDALDNMLECPEMDVCWLFYPEGNPEQLSQIVVPQPTSLDTIGNDLPFFCGSMVVSMAPIAVAAGVAPEDVWDLLWDDMTAIMTSEPVLGDNTLTYSGSVCGIPVTVDLAVTTETGTYFFGFITLTVPE